MFQEKCWHPENVVCMQEKNPQPGDSVVVVLKMKVILK